MARRTERAERQALFGSLNTITTIVQVRAPGLTWFRLPFFVWAQLVTSSLLLLARPGPVSGKSHARGCAVSDKTACAGSTRFKRKLISTPRWQANKRDSD
jgi:hypothetical protein